MTAANDDLGFERVIPETDVPDVRKQVALTLRPGSLVRMVTRKHEHVDMASRTSSTDIFNVQTWTQPIEELTSYEADEGFDFQGGVIEQPSVAIVLSLVTRRKPGRLNDDHCWVLLLSNEGILGWTEELDGLETVR